MREEYHAEGRGIITGDGKALLICPICGHNEELPGVYGDDFAITAMPCTCAACQTRFLAKFDLPNEFH